MAKISEDWLDEHFEQTWLDETDEGAGMYYTKLLGHKEDDLYLISNKDNNEVMLFPYDYIKFTTTDQVESVYYAIRAGIKKSHASR